MQIVQETHEVIRLFDEWGRNFAPKDFVQNQRNGKMMIDYVMKTYGIVSISYLIATEKALGAQLDRTPPEKVPTLDEKAAEFQKREFTRHQKDQLENSEAAFFERAKRAEEAKRLEKEAKEQADAAVQINNEILRYECYRGPNQIDHGKSDGFRKDLLRIEVRRNGKRDAKLTSEAVRKAVSNLP
jgi:hypothetical protein